MNAPNQRHLGALPSSNELETAEDLQSTLSSEEWKHPEPLTQQTQKFPKIISFESLARCGEEIWIENQGQIYRLRRTRQGKLILTK